MGLLTPFVFGSPLGPEPVIVKKCALKASRERRAEIKTNWIQQWASYAIKAETAPRVRKVCSAEQVRTE